MEDILKTVTNLKRITSDVLNGTRNNSRTPTEKKNTSEKLQILSHFLFNVQDRESKMCFQNFQQLN